MLEKVTLNDIQIGVKAIDWKDAIIKSSKILLEKGSIEDKYVEEMIRVLSDVGPYIVLGKHVALAHARPEYGVNELALSFTTLEPPVEFGSENFDPIKLIITLAAIDSNSHIEMLGELADILMNEKKVKALFDAKTKEEFYKILLA